MNFNDRTEFLEFLRNNPEDGSAFEGIEINKPYDLGFKDFDNLQRIYITFDKYENFCLFFHPETKELLLGDVNTGGHAARCRVVKIERDTIFSSPDSVKKWYDRWAWEMWK